VQGSSTRIASNSLRSDLHSLTISTQPSMLSNVYYGHPMPTTSTVSNTAESSSGNLAVSGYSWLSQTLSGFPPAYDRMTRSGVAENVSQPPKSSTIGPTMETYSILVGRPGLSSSDTRGDSRLVSDHGTEAAGNDDDDEYDDNADDSSVLSVSLNRFIFKHVSCFKCSTLSNITCFYLCVWNFLV